EAVRVALMGATNLQPNPMGLGKSARLLDQPLDQLLDQGDLEVEGRVLLPLLVQPVGVPLDRLLVVLRPIADDQLRTERDVFVADGSIPLETALNETTHFLRPAAVDLVAIPPFDNTWGRLHLGDCRGCCDITAAHPPV